ncbi:hypothetical protein O1M63_18450 [Streptomyces mirabilis]|nr:hypothetical protein [Streptomyces mirabilis]
MRTFAAGTVVLAASISFGALQRSFVPYAGASGTTSRRPVSASNPHGLDVTGEFRRGCGEDVAELGEDAAAGGRSGKSALGHHHLETSPP